VLFCGGALFFLPVFVATCTPFMWITSHSLPWGIYRRTQEPIQRGVLIHVCLPEALAAYALEREYLSAGPCPGLYQELLKPVAAVAGDVVEISETGVSVNGSVIPGSLAFSADSHGRPHTVRMEKGWYVVPEGQVFLLSTYHPRSWDGRYFGFLPLSAVRGTVWGVWTW
jgi:conjugative transfer signal peptidase TraF